VTFDTGITFERLLFEQGVKNAYDFPGFVPAYIRPLFCEGKGRSGGRRFQEKLRTLRGRISWCWKCFRGTSICIADQAAQKRVKFRGCRRGFAGWDTASETSLVGAERAGGERAK